MFTPTTTVCGLTQGTVYFMTGQSTSGYAKVYDTLEHAITNDGVTGLTSLTNGYIIIKQLWTTEADYDAAGSNGFHIPWYTPVSTNTTNMTVTFSVPHGLSSGDAILVSATGNGLTAGTVYYASIVDTASGCSQSTIRIYYTSAQAIAGGSGGLVSLSGDITAELSYQQAGTTHGGYLGIGQFLFNTCTTLRHHTIYKTFASGCPGQFCPDWRYNGTGYGHPLNGGQTLTVTGSAGWTNKTVDLASTFVPTVKNSTQFTVTGHTLVTQEAVTLVYNGVNSCGSLTCGEAYYIRSIDANTIQLHASAANANTNTSPLTLTGITCSLRRIGTAAGPYDIDLTTYVASPTYPLRGRLLVRTRGVEDLNQQTGVSTLDFLGVGGSTASGLYSFLSAYTNGVAGQLTDLSGFLNGSKSVCVILQCGGNDYAQSKGASDYSTNLQNMINWWKTGWAAAGFSASNLYFMILCNHPEDTWDETGFAPYQATARTISDNNDNTCAICLERLTTSWELRNMSYYDSGGPAHLAAIGYQELGNRIVSYLAPITPSTAVACIG